MIDQYEQTNQEHQELGFDQELVPFEFDDDGDVIMTDVSGMIEEEPLEPEGEETYDEPEENCDDYDDHYHQHDHYQLQYMANNDMANNDYDNNHHELAQYMVDNGWTPNNHHELAQYMVDNGWTAERSENEECER